MDHAIPVDASLAPIFIARSPIPMEMWSAKPETTEAGLISGEVLAENHKRCGFFITYIDFGQAKNHRVFLAFRFPAELNKGVILEPGDSLRMHDSCVPVESINAIATHPAQVLAIQEWHYIK